MLILIRGLPGSGKTTVAKKMMKGKKGWKHFETDNYHMVRGVYRYNPANAASYHQRCLQDATDAVSKGFTVIVSNTFTTYSEMEPYLDMARDYGVEFKVICCTGDFESTHGVPADIIDRMASRWEDFAVEKILKENGEELNA